MRSAADDGGAGLGKAIALRCPASAPSSSSSTTTTPTFLANTRGLRIAAVIRVRIYPACHHARFGPVDERGRLTNSLIFLDALPSVELGSVALVDALRFLVPESIFVSQTLAADTGATRNIARKSPSMKGEIDLRPNQRGCMSRNTPPSLRDLARAPVRDSLALLSGRPVRQASSGFKSRAPFAAG